MRVAISTGGGDAPGLNAAIRGAVLAALQHDWKVFGIRRGFDGLLREQPDLLRLGRNEVRGIGHLGGTILGTTNRGNPFAWPTPDRHGNLVEQDRSHEVVSAMRSLGFDALIAIGGDGTLGIAHRLAGRGLAVVGIPKTIDNDVGGTAATIGFDTAVGIATEAIDRLHTTAESHERIMVVEVMGRYAGWIALHSGIAGGADIILIPEIPFDLASATAQVKLREQRGRRFSIVVVAEGAIPKGGAATIQEKGSAGRAERLGGIGESVARELERRTGREARALTLGHLQRGGGPTTFDRLLGLRYGTASVRAIAAGRFDSMVAFTPPAISVIPLEEALAQPKQVSPDSDTVATARNMGICLGD